MDPSFNLRVLFLKTAEAFETLQKKERITNARKLILIKDIEDDLFFLKESAKKMLREHKLKERSYELLMKRITKINKELRVMKKELTNP